MANVKFTDLSAATSAETDMMIAVVEDPTGSPVSKSLLLSDLSDILVDKSTDQTIAGEKTFSEIMFPSMVACQTGFTTPPTLLDGLALPQVVVENMEPVVRPMPVVAVVLVNLAVVK